jgi:hypothetical protein
MMKRVVVFTGLAVLASFASAARAETAANGSFRMSAYVPEYCEISAPPLLVPEGDGAFTGSVLETCNTQHGYSVVASHRALDASERIAFSYAGIKSQLQSHGWTEVATRAGARYGLRPISVRHTSLASPLVIVLTLTTF